MDKQLAATSRLLLIALAGVLAALCGAGLAVILLVFPFEAPIAFVLGLAAGGGLSAVKVILLSRNLNRAAEMDRNQAQNSARLQFILRYGLTLGVLALVVIFRAYVGLGGTALGLLALQLAAYVAGGIEQRRENRRFDQNGPPPPLPPDPEDEQAQAEENPRDIRTWFK